VWVVERRGWIGRVAAHLESQEPRLGALAGTMLDTRLSPRP